MSHHLPDAPQTGCVGGAAADKQLAGCHQEDRQALQILRDVALIDAPAGKGGMSSGDSVTESLPSSSVQTYLFLKILALH